MKRFAVVVFDTVCPLYGDVTMAKGGGVCFLADEDRADWPGAIARIAREHLQWDLGRCVEVGIASLDEQLLARHCHKYGTGSYWQGGDEA